MRDEITTLTAQDLQEDRSSDAISVLQPTGQRTAVAHRFCATCTEIKFNHMRAPPYSSIFLQPGTSQSVDGCDFCWFLDQSLSDDFQAGTPTMIFGPVTIEASLNRLGVISQALEALNLGGKFCLFWLTSTSPITKKDSYSILVRSNISISDLFTTPVINFAMVKSWLVNELVRIPETPQPSAVTSELLHGANKADDVEIFVIDCVHQKIERLPSESQYVTLSYVWGSGSQETDATLRNIPLTIRDSIAVVLELGLRYLWVDRYCIPQDDNENRRQQIAHMDKIYHNSVITIVACSGTDPHYGLPGVSRIRRQYPSILIRDFGYLQKLPLSKDIGENTWARRGWTFQEALLSKARLYFCDQQLFFENEHGTTCEANMTSKGSHVDEFNFHPTETLAVIYAQRELMKDADSVYDCIRMFADRSLTFSGDTIDALRGIFAVFERSFRIRHVCGMPYTSLLSQNSTEIPLPSHPMLQKSLNFTTDPGAVRNNDFPSWSWAGWTGGKSWLTITSIIYGFQVVFPTPSLDVDVCVAVETSENDLVDWKTYQVEHDRLSSRTADVVRFIHIKAYLIPILHCRGNAEGILGQILEFESPAHICIKIVKDRLPHRELLIRESERFAVLRLPYQWMSDPNLPHLLMRDRGTHWERVADFRGRYVDMNGRYLGDSCRPGTLQIVRLG